VRRRTPSRQGELILLNVAQAATIAERHFLGSHSIGGAARSPRIGEKKRRGASNINSLRACRVAKVGSPKHAAFCVWTIVSAEAFETADLRPRRRGWHGIAISGASCMLGRHNVQAAVAASWQKPKSLGR